MNKEIAQQRLYSRRRPGSTRRVEKAEDRMHVLHGKCPLRLYVKAMIHDIDCGHGRISQSERAKARLLLRTLRGIAKRANRFADRLDGSLDMDPTDGEGL